MTALLTFRISLYLPDTYPATNTRASNLSTACLSRLPLPGRSRVETMQNNENLFVPAARPASCAIYLQRRVRDDTKQPRERVAGSDDDSTKRCKHGRRKTKR